MSVLANQYPTLLDIAKTTDPDGTTADVVEIMNAVNEVLDDMSWIEGNLPTGNRTTVRTGLPAPTWRKMYGGVQPDKSTYAQVTDNCGMLEAYGEVDKALADLNGNTNSFRLLEDKGQIESMSQTVAQTIFYGNEGSNPAAFTGLAPRYNSLSAANAENIIDAGGTGTDNSSIWLVVWGPDTVHGIIPKGSRAGLQQRDLGEVTVESAPGGGGRYQAYRTHFRFDVGLTVRDWRYIVRIPNIDKSLLIADASTGAYLPSLMLRAINQVPSLSKGRAVFYMPRNIRTWLELQMIEKVKQSTLTQTELQGKMVTMFQGIPIKRVDALAADEARVV